MPSSFGGIAQSQAFEAQLILFAMAPLVFLPTPTRALFVSTDFAALLLMYSAPLLAVGAGAGWGMFRIPIGSYHGSPSGRSSPVNRTKRSPRLIRGLKRSYIFNTILYFFVLLYIPIIFRYGCHNRGL
jgi:hypothetical protein